MIIGKNVGIDYGGETTYGTPVTADTSIGIESSISPVVAKQVIPIYGIGSGSNYSAAVPVALSYTGNITWNFADPTFLRHAIGSLTGGGSNITSDPKVLTEAEEFSVSTSSGVQAFTMKVKKEDGSSDEMDTYAGCYLLGWTLSGGENTIITASADFVSQSLTTGTTIDNAYGELTTVPYIGAQSKFYYDDTPTKVANVVNWTVTMTNRAAIYRSIDNADLEISQPSKSYREYTFTITVRVSQALYNAMKDDVNSATQPLPTTRELQITMSKEDSPSDTDRQCIIQLDAVQLTDYSEPVAVNDDIVQATFNGIAKEGKGNIPIKWTD